MQSSNDKKTESGMGFEDFRLLLSDNLSTNDPYDAWKIQPGRTLKRFYNRNRIAGIIPAAGLTILDLYFLSYLRLSSLRQEYPIVRALAVQTIARSTRIAEKDKRKALDSHVGWLLQNSCESKHGIGWGLGFEWEVTATLKYSSKTPTSTMTPYCLEALIDYENTTGSEIRPDILSAISQFFHSDIHFTNLPNDCVAASYGPGADRIVINASSYVMYALALLLRRGAVEDAGTTQSLIKKLYGFICSTQRSSGAFPYALEGNTFIDCFHSCFILKNVLKTNALFRLDKAGNLVTKGLNYLRAEMYDPEKKLYRRFSKTNKPGTIRFDLYDQAEMINLLRLLGDSETAVELDKEVLKRFVSKDNTCIYSQIDRIGIRHYKDSYRWALMPYVYAREGLTEKG